MRLDGILLAGLCALGPAGLVHAQSTEALAWLRKIHDATQKLSYTGTFVYQNGSRSETSRITRYVDASGDIEKLEGLDGVPREIVRTKDTVRCYLPGKSLVKVDRRTERDFPTLLPERITALALHYGIGLGGLYKFLVFVSGVIIPIFAVTGFLMWWIKRRNRRAGEKARQAILRAAGQAAE